MTIEWTPERNDVLKRDWPDGVDTDVVVHRMNLLPGEMVGASAVRCQAAKLKVKRPAWYRVAQAQRAQRARTEQNRAAKLIAENEARARRWFVPPTPEPQPEPPVAFASIQRPARPFSMLGGRIR